MSACFVFPSEVDSVSISSLRIFVSNIRNRQASSERHLA